MKRKLITAGVVVVIVAGLAVLNQFAPDRMTQKDLQEAKAVQEQLDNANKPAETERPDLAEEIEAADDADLESEILTAPNLFRVKFECDNGDFVVEVHRDWAPLGAARFEEIVKAGLFKDMRVFRVVPGFVVQFGISGDPAVSAKWREKTIKDEPVKESNRAGTITFAKGGPNSRTTQLFVNLADNPNLDAMGFPPFGEVIQGMDVVQGFNSQYGDTPTKMQAQIQAMGNMFLDQRFPGLSTIELATIIADGRDSAKEEPAENQ